MFRKLLIALFAALALNAYAAVDANQASQAELEAVKGIGPALSTKILKARESGAFKNWGDMVERVSGIGPGNAGKFSAAGLTVGGASFDAAALPAPAPKATRKGGADKAAAKVERGEAAGTHGQRRVRKAADAG
ncbi:MAG TPA: helix-hairpin-helix domain-containing protein [Rubrivivax sp.]|jgi:competence protein ComEA|nr:helix-hairpin-helix domain-containing protein [Pseudomonadota bacterium]HPP82877.1 helix-hairpin-helix domain-containing protein [Rubrivivax sp.]